MEIVNVDPTILGDVVACKTKAWVRHVKGYTSHGDAAAALAGSAFHAAVAEWLDPCNDARPGERYDGIDKEAVRVFHEVYDQRYAALGADQLEPRFTPTNLERVLARWLETHPPALLPWARVLHVEEALATYEWRLDITGAFPQSVRLIIRPDAIVERADGRVVAVDTKTTGWITDAWKGQQRLGAQISAYIDGTRQMYGARAALGALFNAVELRQLPSDPKRKCHEHGRPYAECGAEHAKMEFIEAARTSEMLDRWRADAEAAVRDFVWLRGVENVESVPMDGAFSGRCMFCPMQQWCEAGRPVAALNDFFVHDPWVVKEGERA